MHPCKCQKTFVVLPSEVKHLSYDKKLSLTTGFISLQYDKFYGISAVHFHIIAAYEN